METRRSRTGVSSACPIAVISLILLCFPQTVYPSPEPELPTGATRQAGSVLAQAGVTQFRVMGVEIREAAPGSAIIRIQANQPIRIYDAYSLPNPPRLVIDIPEAYLGERMPTRQAGKGPITLIRSSQYRRKPKPVVRVVLDLVSELPYKVEGIAETFQILIGEATVKAPPQPPAVPAGKPKPAPEVETPAGPEQPAPSPPAPVNPERPNPAAAKPAKPEQPLEELERKLQIIREQQERMQAEQQRLLQEIERFRAEQVRLREEQAKARLSEEEAKRVVAGQAPGQEIPGQEAPAKETLSIERLLVTRGNVLLRQGQIEIEPSVQYAHFSAQQLSVSGFAILPSLVIGQISTQRIQRDVIVPALTVRGGIFDWLQIEGTVPYRWQEDRLTDSLTVTEGEATNQGIGDVEGALSLHVLRERGWVPDLLLSFRYKSRTGEDPFEVDAEETIGGTTLFKPPLGTGFETYRPGITLVKSVDPAVIFGGFGVVLSKERTVTLQNGLRATIDAGDSYEFNVGLAFALNPDISLNAQYIQRFTEHTEFIGIELGGSKLNVGTANFGFTWALSRHLAMDFTVGIGLTEDAPDVTAQIRLPFRFSLK